MITVDDTKLRPSSKKNKSRQPAPFDPWEDWKPVWTGKGGTPHDFQERNAPTETVSVKLSSKRYAQKGQRRIVEARLWESLTPSQQDAALEISFAFETMSRGMGYAASNWQRIPGGRGAGGLLEAQARLVNVYIEWTKECHKNKVSHSMIADVLVFGFPPSMLDCDRRVRKGTSRQNLIDGLDLYCKLKGWDE